MPLCQANRKAPSFPKMLGQSSPRGHQMYLVDNGPEHAGPDARYVLTVDETATPFSDEAAATKAWQTAFQACFKTEVAVEDEPGFAM